MAADYSAYDAGTAFLTIEGRLSDTLEADLAAELATIGALPIALSPDMERFAKDLDKQWSDLDKKLKVQLDPVLDEQISKNLEPFKIDAILNTDEADVKLREFFSLTPVFTIPAMLDTTIAEAQIEDLRAKAIQPITIPVTVAAQGTAAGPSATGGGRRAGAQNAQAAAGAAAPQATTAPAGASASAPGAAPRSTSRSTPRAPDLDTFQRDLLARMIAAQQEAERQLPLTPRGEDIRQQILSSSAGIRSIISSPLPASPAAAAYTRRAYRDAVDDFSSGAHRDMASVGVGPRAVAPDVRSGMDDLTKFFSLIGKDVSLGNILQAVPALGGKSSWTGLLSSGGADGGPSAGVAALGAAAGPTAAAATALGMGLKTAAGAAIDFAEKVSKFAAIAGALSLAGGMLAQAGAAGITGMVGMHNIMPAIAAGTAIHEWQIDPNAQLQHQSALISAQQGQTVAAQGLEHAQWDVADATFGVKVAQAELTQAQESAYLAQRSLNEAYMDAGRSVRDMNTALQDAKLNQEGAAIAVAQARHNLMMVQMDPGATIIDRQQALHQVQYSQQRYLESKNKTADQAVDTGISNTRGVTDSTQVLQAQKAQQAATLGVEEAAHQQVDAAHQVVIAMEGVQAAGVQIQLAGIAMKEALNPDPINAYQVALSKLSPSAREFVEAVIAAEPEMRKLQTAISDQLFYKLADSINKFMTDQGLSIGIAMTGIAQALNTGLRDTLTDLDGLFTRMQHDGTWDAFIKGVEGMAKGIAPLITGVVDLFMTLGAKTSDVVGPLMTQLGQTLTDIAPALGDLAAAFGKGLLDALPSLTTMITALAEAAVPIMPSLSSFFQEIAHIITELAPDIGPFVSGVLDDIVLFLKGLDESGGLKALADDFVLLVRDVGPLMKPMGELVGKVLPALFGALITGLPWLEKMGPKFADWFEKAWPLIDKMMTFADNTLPKVVTLVDDLAHPIDLISTAFEKWWGWVDKLVGGFDHLVQHLSDLTALAASPGSIVKDLVGFITGGTLFGHAAGGPISGPGTATSDSIPARLSDGEYVVNAQAAGQHRGLLDAINYGPGYALGGVIRAGSAALLARDVTQGKYGKMMRRIGEKAVPGFASGGPVNARQWGMDHPNIPYVWGGTDLGGVDCSGYTGLLQQVSMGVGNPVARLGVTGDAVAGTWPRFEKGATKTDAFVIGANATHMAVSILGTNFEARQAGENVRVGLAASSPFDPQFSTVGHVDPQAFEPPYSGTGKDGAQADVDKTAAGTDQLAAQVAPAAKKESTWSGWAGHNVTNAIMSLANYGTVFPPFGDPNAGTAGPMAGLSNAMTSAVHNAPDDQKTWLSKFLLGTATPPSDQMNTGKAAPGTAPAVSTPDNPDAGTANAPDALGTDAVAGEGASGGVLGALQHGIGGLAKAAGSAVSGQLSSVLNVLGGGSSLDQVPGWVQGGYQLYLISQQPALNPDTVMGNKDATGQKPDAANPDTAGQSPDTAAPAAPAPAPAPAPAKPAAPPQEQNKAAQDHSGAGEQNKMASQANEGLPAAHTYNPGQGVAQWSPMFANVLHNLGMPASWLGIGLQQMDTESNGNPKAINLDDSNAAAGHPSKGLMQVIDPTFNMEYGKFAKLGYPNDVWDPRSNIAAGLEWVVQADGSPVGVWGHGHGYAAGGEVNGDGSSIGDMVPAMLSDGEYVINARSADAHRSLLRAVNADQLGVNQLQLKQVIPNQALSGAGRTAGGVDNSATYNIHTADVEQGFRRASVYQAQRAATYLSRWR